MSIGNRDKSVVMKIFDPCWGVDDQNKTDHNAHGTPKKIDGTIPYHDMGFTIGGAGSLNEAGNILEQGSEFDFLSVFSFRTPSFFGANSRPVSHGIFTHMSDQVVSAVQ